MLNLTKLLQLKVSDTFNCNKFEGLRGSTP
jgi:hypothetical protein